MHGEEGTFDASCSVADTYTWQFGDGTTSNDSIAKHVFLAPGRYYVNLTTYKNGQRDDIYGYIDITASEQEQSCLPSYATNLSMWPSPEADSVVFLYGGDKKMDEIQWFVSKAIKYTSAVKLTYDGQGKMTAANFYRYDDKYCINSACQYLTAPVEYDEKGLPSRIQFKNVPSYEDTISAEFNHNLAERLTDIKYSMPSGAVILKLTTSYQYDAYGNTTGATYDGNIDGIKTSFGRENTAFYSTLTFYSASKELKFFFEYIVGIEPYVNSLKWSTVKANRGGPGWTNYRSFTDPDMNNPPGLDREYHVKVDPNKNLPVQLAPNTEDVILTDLTYAKVVYTCDLD